MNAIVSSMSDVENAVKQIRAVLPEGFEPRLAVMLGSGLSPVADLLDEKAALPYTDIPGFPQPTVAGHEGHLRAGYVGNVPVIFLKGRQHYYEGEGFAGLKVIIRSLKTLGVQTLFLTNAAGSLRAESGVGSLVIIRDHINLMGMNPLIGPNDDDWGPRFVSMDNCWDEKLRQSLTALAADHNIPAAEGVYAAFAGPNFETPAEVRMAGILGADTVGMSTVPENLIARHCGLICVGVSAITNLAEGLGDETLSHDHTLAGAEKAAGHMASLIQRFITTCF